MTMQDEPADNDNTGLNWEQEVRDLVRLETICNRQAAADKVRLFQALHRRRNIH